MGELIPVDFSMRRLRVRTGTDPLLGEWVTTSGSPPSNRAVLVACGHLVGNPFTWLFGRGVECSVCHVVSAGWREP